MDNEQKILYFQYTLDQLLRWYKDAKGSEESNDLSILKSLKLLFFVSAAQTTSKKNDSLVDLVFDKYVAMPYGHVEQDVYSTIKERQGVLEYFTITNNNTVRTNYDIPLLASELNSDYRKEIEESVKFLRANHNNLITLGPFELVELSHLWYSWRKNYDLAKQNGSRVGIIPIADIKIETKVFSY